MTPPCGLLHHVEIYVSDLAVSREFWGWLLPKLGYKLQSEWARGFDYIHGETYLVFVQTEERFLTPSYHRCRTGLNHLAFHAASRAQVDEITLALRKQKRRSSMKIGTPFAGGKDYYAVFFEDPDRIKVELVAGE